MATKGTSEAFIYVCDRELGIDEFYDVYEKIKSLSAHWRQIAISLRLRIDTISKIRANANGDITTCLQEVLECWLKKDYDYERHGVPCWRKVCVAVKEGGGDSALADEIAKENPATGGATPHLLPATTGGTTPHLIPATTGGATPRTEEAGSTASISTPSIYVSKAITDFELHRELLEIQDRFSQVIEDTIEYYQNHSLKRLTDYIIARIHIFFAPHENTPDKAQAVRKEFKEITTIEDLFGLLQDKYTSWFKYGPIKKLVDERVIEYIDEGSDYKAKNCWSWYEMQLHEYFKKCVTVDDPASYGITDAPPGKQILIVKVDRGDYNQNDHYFLRKAIPPELDRPDLKLYLCQVLS